MVLVWGIRGGGNLPAVWIAQLVEAVVLQTNDPTSKCTVGCIDEWSVPMRASRQSFRGADERVLRSYAVYCISSGIIRRFGPMRSFSSYKD